MKVKRQVLWLVSRRKSQVANRGSSVLSRKGRVSGMKGLIGDVVRCKPAEKLQEWISYLMEMWSYKL